MGATLVATGSNAADPGLEPVTSLKGAGTRLREALARLGIERVRDLWFHLPLRYEDRTAITPIRSLLPGARAQVEGTVQAVERGFRFRPQLRVAIEGDDGGTLVLRFFHFRGSQADQFVVGTRVRAYGEARLWAEDAAAD